MHSFSREHMLLRQLADGRFHSGQALANGMGISRTAVWKQLKRIERDCGVAVHAVRGRGYRLANSLELLDEGDIRAQLGELATRHVEAVRLVMSTPSTNSAAAAATPDRSGRARVWLAEHQTAGRGRRGREWFSSFGENIVLSVAWRFDLPMSALSALSLASGVAVAEALSDLGVQGHGLKWPNDLLAGDRKLAGILVEVSGEVGGPAVAIIGVGVNRRLPVELAKRIDQPWTDLTALDGGNVSRNVLAGTLIDRLVNACDVFARHGIEPYLDRWLAFDHLHGHRVRVRSGERVVEGVYAGIAANGALILDTADGRSEHHAGEVSLRGADPQ